MDQKKAQDPKEQGDSKPSSVKEVRTKRITHFLSGATVLFHGTSWSNHNFLMLGVRWLYTPEEFNVRT